MASALSAPGARPCGGAAVAAAARRWPAPGCWPAAKPRPRPASVRDDRQAAPGVGGQSPPPAAVAPSSQRTRRGSARLPLSARPALLTRLGAPRARSAALGLARAGSLGAPILRPSRPALPGWLPGAAGAAPSPARPVLLGRQCSSRPARLAAARPRCPRCLWSRGAASRAVGSPPAATRRSSLPSRSAPAPRSAPRPVASVRRRRQTPPGWARPQLAADVHAALSRRRPAAPGLACGILAPSGRGAAW